MDIIDRIEAKSIQLREAATALSEKILSVERAIATIPGKVPTEYETDTFILRLGRSGKDWKLTVIEMANQTCGNEKHLTEASLKIKFAVIKILPDFILAMERSQTKLIDDIASASLVMDNLLADIKTAFMDRQS